MIVKAVREGLGRIIIFVDFITSPKKISRSDQEQTSVDEATKNLSLYQFYACPFCVKTRRAIRRLNIPVEIRDAQNDQTHRQALLEGGGAIKVPCLRIDGGEQAIWMYESSDIIAHLNQQFDPDFDALKS